MDVGYLPFLVVSVVFGAFGGMLGVVILDWWSQRD